MMHRARITLLLLLLPLAVASQTVIGTEGLLNVPTADMRHAGTFDGGASLIDNDLLYSKNYKTGIYYINFTPFSWMEITYRETLIKTRKSAAEPKKIGYYQQDRSTTLRLRPLREGRWWPSVVVGANDIYSDHGGSRYACFYGVATKNIALPRIGTLGLTAGYAYARKKGTTYGTTYDGVMGGFSFSPAFWPALRIMGDYDTRGFNVGAGAILFKHLCLTCFTNKMKGVNATVSYRYTIKY